VKQDSVEAMRWFQKAGHEPTAEFGIGNLYFLGHGVTRDYAEALEWFQKAADQGLSQSQDHLAVMYFLGNGVPQDYVQAYMWATIAADAKGQAAIGSKLTPDQIAEAKRRASQWKPVPAPAASFGP
jgi:TPR repeat protein